MAVAAVMLSQVQLSLGANCRVEEKGGDVWASPGATGTHTLPLAFPGDRPADLPSRG